LLSLFDVLDDIADALQFFRLFVGDFVAEFLFESHDQLDGIERVSAQVFDELGFRGDLVGIHAELLDNDIFYSLFNSFFSHGFLRFLRYSQCVYVTVKEASSLDSQILELNLASYLQAFAAQKFARGKAPKCDGKLR
jgi:hypothetical protein